MEVPPKKFFRLGVGLMVRLKNAYIIKCEDFVKDADGNVPKYIAATCPNQNRVMIPAAST
jgi:glutaminyl-tRNA synthetase